MSETRPLFPLLLVSGALLAFYDRVLKPRRNDRGALALLLKSWWTGPRALPLTGLQRASALSYSLTLEEDFCSDEMGRTTLLLLEDGRPLPLPHCTSVKKIASQGQGRWVHVGRKIFFAPSDNADLGQKPHQYHLIDGLGGNPDLFGALSKLVQLKATFPNPAAYALAKLQLMLGPRLAVGAQKALDARRLELANLRLDLSAAGLPDLTATRMTVELQQDGETWHIRAELTGVVLGALTLDSLGLAVALDHPYQPRLVGLDAVGDGRQWVAWRSDSRDCEWRGARLELACLDSLHRGLAACCGGSDGARAWLAGFLAGLEALDLGVNLDPADRQGLLDVLAGAADESPLTMSFAPEDARIRVRITPRPDAVEPAPPPAPASPADLSATLPADWPVQVGKPLDGDFVAQVGAILPDSPSGPPAPVVRGIPRFVASDHYVASFSFQWTTYTDTQLDSQQGVDLTEQDLLLKTGLSPEEVAGKLVLDAGVGTGRHAEVLARWGARVVGVDLSEAVETARDNLARFPNALVMQADIGALPFKPESFDLIYSIGVLHHTPGTRAHAEKLLPLLKPGGTLALWVYPPKFQRRGEWTPLVSRLPATAFQAWCEWVIDLARPRREAPWMEAFIRQFPFATHHPTPQRSVLALFDGYTPTYHWNHGNEEVAGWFKQWGLEDVRILEEPTALRGRKPRQD